MPNFWGEQIAHFKPIYERYGVPIEDKLIKKILKVGVYTSLNGGNPASHDRIFDNLSENAGAYLPKDAIEKAPVYLATKEILESFQILKEVKDLNKECFTKAMDKTFTYTIDRKVPYQTESSYKGISRVLQSFEVVLLSILTREVIRYQGLPLSLDHDGLMALFILEEEVSIDSPILTESIKQMEIALTNSMKDWAQYLLKSNVPIETKRYWVKGEMVEN